MATQKVYMRVGELGWDGQGIRMSGSFQRGAVFRIRSELGAVIERIGLQGMGSGPPL